MATGQRDDARSGVRRHANLIGALGGFRSLAEVRSAFPAGLDPRDAAWMWRRLLVAIGAAHRAGVIHGAVLPEHVLIHPAEHGLVLVDWCYSVSGPARRGPGHRAALPALVPEHPRSLAIAVLFDVTGSMRGVPRVLQVKLPQLLELLPRKGYTADPQIMFGAIGDATCDRAPLQVGQFESDNRMDDDLGRILLEGGGGGQKTESYELALDFMARHTAIDCYAKRGRCGYLFVIGDEMAYPQVKPAEVGDVIGGGLQASLPLPALIDEVDRGKRTHNHGRRDSCGTCCGAPARNDAGYFPARDGGRSMSRLMASAMAW